MKQTLIFFFPENEVSIKPEILEVDHIFPNSENHSHVAVLYSELGTPEFSQMHKVLQDLASNNRLSYLFRHFVKVGF